VPSEMVGFKASKGNSKTFDSLFGLEKSTRRVIRQAWFQWGRDLKREAQRTIDRDAKTGIVYRNVLIRSGPRKGKIKRRHQSSAPGESHANLSRELKRSLSWMVHGTEAMSFGYGFASATAKAARAAPVYGATIEFGSRPGRRPFIAARPTLANTLRHEQAKFITAFEDAFEREITGTSIFGGVGFDD